MDNTNDLEVQQNSLGMPTLASTNTRTAHLLNEGGIEECAGIEVEENGEVVIAQSPFLHITQPGNSILFDRSPCSLVDVVEEDEEDAEGIEVQSEFLTFLDTLMYGCAGCEPCTTPCVNKPKEGILKTGRSKALSAQPLNHRTVSFSSLEIKEFKMSLGDHPCSSSGPPVMLDWDSRPTLERVVSLDEYERLRSPRRSRSKLKLSYRDRKGILEEQQGFTTEEVNRAWAEAIRIRQQRHETLKRGVLLNTWDDMYESWQRKCHRAAEAVGIV
jgi:hypothetical protein